MVGSAGTCQPAAAARRSQAGRRTRPAYYDAGVHLRPRLGPANDHGCNPGVPAFPHVPSSCSHMSCQHSAPRHRAMLSAPLFAAPLFENARIRISDLRLPAKVTTTFEHTFPSVRWQVDPGVHSLGDGPPMPVADKAVTFMEAGTTWVCRNDGEAESRQIVFEIKQPPSHTEAEAAALLARAEFSTDVGTALLFENRLCRVWDFCNSPPFNPGPTTNL